VARARTEPFLAEPGNAVFMALEDGRLVGVATVTTGFGFETGCYAEVEDLYVEPEQRGRGLAVALLDAAFAWCRSEGCAEVEVVVTPDAEARHGLGEWYRRQGFADTGRMIYSRRL
jgi:aminoglycoside 6'-N-acetyltransferase I